MPKKLTKWLLLQKFIAPVLLLVGLSVIGTIGYVVLEDYTWLDGLYMAVITIGTVGFSEIKPLDYPGKIFTIFLVLASLATVAFYITMVTRLLLDGEWRRQYRMYRQSKKLKEMQDHVIVCGYGRNGRQACQVLKQNQIPFTVIEQRQHLANDTHDHDGEDLIIPGDATRDSLLLEAGIMKAKALISSLPNDADNLFVVLTARQLNPHLTIISRASEDHSIQKLKIAGATNVIMPDKLGGAHMASLVLFPDVHEFLSVLSTGHSEHFRISEIKVTEAFNLGEMNIWQRTGCTVLGVKQIDGKYLRNPPPNYIVMESERMIVMGTEEQLEAARKLVL